jgi:hypothetical protein
MDWYLVVELQGFFAEGLHRVVMLVYVLKVLYLGQGKVLDVVAIEVLRSLMVNYWFLVRFHGVVENGEILAMFGD